MKRYFGSMVIVTALLSGCGENGPPPGEPRAAVPAAPNGTGEKSETSRQIPPTLVPQTAAPSIGEMNSVIATVNGEPITMRELMDPLIKAHGLTMLANLARLEVVRQDARKNKIVVTAQDVEAEYRITQEKWFKDADDARMLEALDRAIKEHRDKDADLLREEIKSERDQFLAQFLAKQNIDEVVFDIVQKINAHLRKFAEPQVEKMITDKALHIAFGKRFGERIYVKYMALANMNEVTEAKRRMAAGETFESVAKDMSRDPRTKGLGGELRPFTRAEKVTTDDATSNQFKDVAFALRDGQVSDVLVMGRWFELIKRIEVKPPEHVKFEDVKDSVHRELHDELMEPVLKDLKYKLDAMVFAQFKVQDPVLKSQFNAKARDQATIEKDTKELEARQARIRDLVNPISTQPAVKELIDKLRAPTTAAATNPAESKTGDRPPATQPAPAH